MLQLTATQVQGLAPDPASVAAGRKLGKPAPWKNLGRSGDAVWGECQGSAVYQTRVALSDFASKCSCPSRKFPCKHALGLLFLAAESPGAIPEAGAPEWVTSWLEKREESAAKKQARAAAPDTPVDEAAQKKRREKRQANIDAGLEALDLWMNDLVRRGLASVGSESPSFWDAQARRLVDAQAPGLAAMLRRIAGLVGTKAAAPQRLLDELGALALLTHAARRVDALDPPLAADVRRLLGLVLDQTEVVAHGDLVDDEWQVLAEVVDDVERVRSCRTWLRGRTSGRLATVVQFAAGTARFAEALPIGTVLRAKLAFWPSAHPRRALIVERGETTSALAPPPGEPIAAALDRFATALGRLPWIERELFVLDSVVPVGDATLHLVDAAGDALPLEVRDPDVLLSVAGGRPLSLGGEWDGYTFVPLVAWAHGRTIDLARRRA